MSHWMDKFETVGEQLQELGKKAINSAADGFEKARPIVQDKIDDVMEACQKAKPIIEDNVEKAVDNLRSAFEKARPAIEEGMDKAAKSAKEIFGKADESASDNPDAVEDTAEGQEESELTQEQEIELDVQSKLEKIRAAASKPNMISDFIKNKYGKDE